MNIKLFHEIHENRDTSLSVSSSIHAPAYTQKKCLWRERAAEMSADTRSLKETFEDNILNTNLQFKFICRFTYK